MFYKSCITISSIQSRRELRVRLNLQSPAPMARGDNLVLRIADEAVRAQVDAVKEEWRLLWLSRIDDKVRAEGIANQFFRCCPLSVAR